MYSNNLSVIAVKFSGLVLQPSINISPSPVFRKQVNQKPKGWMPGERIFPEPDEGVPFKYFQVPNIQVSFNVMKKTIKSMKNTNHILPFFFFFYSFVI